MKKAESYKSEDIQTSFSYAEKLGFLRLIRSENIGPRTFFQLMSMYKTAEKALQAAEGMSVRGGRKEPIKICSVEKAEKEIEQCEKIGAQIILHGEKAYPKKLSFIPDPPPVITALGDIHTLQMESIAIVGARNASANGFRMARSMAAQLAEEGYSIISGMARGIDTAAHKGALEKGRTVAVIAGGVDIIYPKENADLYQKIQESGAVIAELPFSTTPRAENFPQRNRIISGISLGTIIVEAAVRSGSLITARFALEQGREVMAIPGFPMDPRAEGPNKLIKNGAALVENPQDVIDAIKHAGERKISGFFEETEDFIPKSPPSDEDLSDIREVIINNLNASPTPVDSLIEITGAETSSVLGILLELELAGRLLRHAGGRVSLSSFT